jgi:hypothetical protein
VGQRRAALLLLRKVLYSSAAAPGIPAPLVPGPRFPEFEQATPPHTGCLSGARPAGLRRRPVAAGQILQPYPLVDESHCVPWPLSRPGRTHLKHLCNSPLWSALPTLTPTTNGRTAPVGSKAGRPSTSTGGGRADTPALPLGLLTRPPSLDPVFPEFLFDGSRNGCDVFDERPRAVS